DDKWRRRIFRYCASLYKPIPQFRNEVSKQTLRLLTGRLYKLTASQSCAETRFRQSSADAAAATTELRLTSLPDVERFPNLKLSLSNPKTTTIDEIN
ncbi:hypothetical protein J6590_097293, partial [Homalodisca vitripennis]